MGILERIKEIELELSRTQINKATTTHIGMLKSQLSKLRTQVGHMARCTRYLSIV